MGHAKDNVIRLQPRPDYGVPNSAVSSMIPVHPSRDRYYGGRQYKALSRLENDLVARRSDRWHGKLLELVS